MKSDPVMKSCTSAFILQNKSQEDISDIGKNMMVDLFGGKYNDTLSSLHHRILIKRVATAQAFVTFERLPPTSPATRFYSQRVYFQIMVWMGMANEINDWGWKQENDQLIPIMTQNNVALKTVTIPTTLKRSILRRTLKTDRSETYAMDKGEN